MDRFGSWWRRYRARFLTGLVAPGLVACCVGVSRGEPEVLGQPIAVAPKAAPTVADLAHLRQIALEKQPTLEAYRSSLAAAHARLRGLDQLRLATVVRPDLPTRRKQAEQGIVAAEAQLELAGWETRYAVTRTYLSAVFAREQLRVADKTLSKDRTNLGLEYLLDTARQIFKDETRPDIRAWHVEQIRALRDASQGRRAEAEQGVHRALAALREAAGLGGTCAALADDIYLAEPPAFTLTCDQVVELALGRRGEIALAHVGVELTELEIKAQSCLFTPTAPTFAIGSDLHVKPIVQGQANGEYLPGGVGLEMPPTMTGCRSARVEQAQALNGRAHAVAEKARQLVTLEAEDTFHKWQIARQEYVQYRSAYEANKKAADLLVEKWNPTDKDGGRPTWDDLVATRTRLTQAELQVNRARYQLWLTLAALERVTAGGYCPGFDPPAALPGRP
jgi:outer membrane protein TolC